VSIAPEGIIPAGAGGRVRTAGLAGEPDVRIRDITRVRLAPGDRLLIQCDGTMDLGPGAARELAARVAAVLRLDELGFGVPVVVAAPGMRIEVLHP
jgi:hypothetical protein